MSSIQVCYNLHLLEDGSLYSTTAFEICKQPESKKPTSTHLSFVPIIVLDMSELVTEDQGVF